MCGVTKLHRKIESYNLNKTHSSRFDILHDIHVELKEALPHGSGIDSDWQISQIEGQENLIFSCTNSFHAMDQHGYYCGYVDFEVIIDLEKTNWPFEVKVNENDIATIEKSYEPDPVEVEGVDEGDWSDENACPYLDDLDDYIYESIDNNLEMYVLRQTVLYTKELAPYLLSSVTS